MRTLSLSIAPWLMTALVAFAACTTEDGTTPSCINDVNQDGIHRGNDIGSDGCNPAPPCRNKNGQVVSDPENEELCCKGLEGLDMQACLYGYGAIESVSGGTSSSTGGGSGGGGGAGGSG